MMEIKIEYNCLKADQKNALGLLFEVTAPEAPADETPKAREPKGIVFVIDRSGSMGGGRLERVKQTIIDMLPRLGQDDYLSVVTFDNHARVELPLTQIKDAKLAELRATIGNISTGGSTNLETGYRHGLAEAAKAPAGERLLFQKLRDDPEARDWVVFHSFDIRRHVSRAQGEASAEKAIVQACIVRFRPIMMTTMAALLGALPLALESGTGSELRNPLGISIVGGHTIKSEEPIFGLAVVGTVHPKKVLANADVPSGCC